MHPDDPISPPAALGAALMLLVAALAFAAGFAAADESDAIGPTDAPEPVSGHAPGGGW